MSSPECDQGAAGDNGQGAVEEGHERALAPEHECDAGQLGDRAEQEQEDAEQSPELPRPAERYPFTAPAVRPLTKCSTKKE